MELGQEELMMVLERREPWNWRATVWRKLPNGRIVRFIDWNWKG